MSKKRRKGHPAEIPMPGTEPEIEPGTGPEEPLTPEEEPEILPDTEPEEPLPPEIRRIDEIFIYPLNKRNYARNFGC